MINKDSNSLRIAQCQECGEVKLCIPFAWRNSDGHCGVNYYCPECNEETEEWLDHERERCLRILPLTKR